MRELLEAGDQWTKGEKRKTTGVKVIFLRYIYWNAHFFGENFYGWSIGDAQSLVESGPFHSQGIRPLCCKQLKIISSGRVGASNQPWQGSWRANVTVELINCNLPFKDRRIR